MKFSKREDIDAPVDFVYQALADTGHWERAALRRGAEVTRLDSMPKVGPGSTWAVGFAYRGRPRKVMLKVAEMTAQQSLAFTGEGEALDGKMTLELVDMGPRRTRVTVALEMTPRTLAARLFLQTLKLAKGRVQEKFDKRVAQIAQDVAERFSRQSRR